MITIAIDETYIYHRAHELGRQMPMAVAVQLYDLLDGCTDNPVNIDDIIINYVCWVNGDDADADQLESDGHHVIGWYDGCLWYID